MDLRNVGCGGIAWIDLALDRDRRRAFVNTVMNLQVPYSAGNFLSDLGRVSFSGRTLHRGVGYRDDMIIFDGRQDSINVATLSEAGTT